MAMGKRPAARQASPMWVDTADLPTNDGHPYFERLNRVLADSGFDAFVEELCAAFYADRLGRPSLRPGRYFRMLFIGYFEGLSSERGIAWRVADSLSLRSFLDLELTEASPDHSTLSRTRRRIDVETHEAVFTWILERLSAAGLVRGKTVGIDATTLEANAAMRSIERRDTGESHEAFIRRLAEASGVETPTRADLARFDRSRKNKKTSNKEWKSPQDPDAKIAKMKDGRTHLAHKAEHGVDMDTGAIVAVTVQDASDGDTATLPETLIMAAEQVEAVQPAGAGVEEVVADKGYHSDETLVGLGAGGVRSHVSEPERGRRCWQDKKTGETPPEKRAAQKALYANRRRVRGRRGRRLQRCRGEVVERTFAHMYETGGMRRVWVRGHENVRKRVLPSGGRLQHRAAPAQPDRHRYAPEPAGAGCFGDLPPDRAFDRPLGASDARLGVQMDTGDARWLNRSSPSCLNSGTQRTDFFHGLIGHQVSSCNRRFIRIFFVTPRARQMTYRKPRRLGFTASPGMRHKQRVVMNTRDNGRRVRVDDHLSKGIVGVDRFVDINGKFTQQFNHGRNSKRVHPVLRLLQAEQPSALGVGLHDREGEKPQRAVGQRTRNVLRPLATIN